ncbi:Lrp/AsnC family transcriptional regulator [bacterium]|nr:Lrp/AsnC family transcriptional regulator [bacterium]
MIIDPKNRRILDIIQENAKISNSEISKEVGIPPTTVFERLKKLDKEKVITGYKAVIDPEKIGLNLVAFVFIRTSGVNYDESLEKEINAIPYVLELHEVAGDYSYLAKVCVKNQGHLSQILKKHFMNLNGIASTNSHIVLKTSKSNGAYPVLEE